MTDLLRRFTFDRLATAVFFVLVATVACLMPIQTDTWWQLRGGQDFWQTGTVPLVETYSHTATGRVWMNHEWLSEAIFYAAYVGGGLPLLTLLAVGLATGSVALCWTLMRGPSLLRVSLLGLALGTMSIAWTPRPHVFTLFFVGLVASMITKGRQWWLPGVFLIWANLHGGFTLGVGVLGAFWMSGLGTGWRMIAKRSALVTLCLATTLATPLGLTFWVELPASLARLQAYQVQEWQGPRLTDPSVLPFWVVLGALGWLVATQWSQLMTDPADRVLTVASLLFAPLALSSLRNIPPFLVLSLPVVSRGIRIGVAAVGSRLSLEQARIHAGMLALTLVVAIGVVATAWAGPLPRLGWRPVSDEALVAVAACDGPLYNSYDDGGFLIWFLPGRPVFLDSRQDPYPVDVIQRDIRAQVETDYRETFERYGVRCAFLRSGVPLDVRLQQDGWQPRHRDAVWTVLEATPPATVRSEPDPPSHPSASSDGT